MKRTKINHEQAYMSEVAGLLHNASSDLGAAYLRLSRDYPGSKLVEGLKLALDCVKDVQCEYAVLCRGKEHAA
ncbi:hypothetical protein JXQ70_19840 [bacterium]|nr:hypothetical protein [bacterium]